MDKIQKETSHEVSNSRLPKVPLNLSGIIYMDGEYLALINDKFLKSGDFIEGSRIVKITDNQVYLKRKNQIFSLHIK